MGEYFLGDGGCIVLANFLESHDTFTELDLHGNNITGTGIRYLTKYLAKTSVLKELTLEWNDIGISAQGMEEFCEALIQNNSIISIDLRNNKISEIASMPLATLIKSTKTIQKIDLRWNEIGTDGARSFVPALEHNQSIIEFEISGNNISQDVVFIIGKYVNI